MKIGICIPKERILLLTPGAADYAELRLTEIQAMTAEDIRETKKDLSSVGLGAETANGFFPSDVRMCGKYYDKKALTEYCKRGISNAAELDIHTIVLGSSAARNIDEGEDPVTCMKQIEESFLISAEVASEYNTTIVLEHLNRRECNTLNTAKEGAELVRRIAHPNLQLLVDFFHFSYEKEPYSVFYDNKDIIKHMHIAHPVTRFTPAEGDGFNYYELKGVLDDINYGGRMSIEAIYKEDFAQDAKESLGFVKKVFGK